MISRSESLSNQTFKDITAWRAIRSAERRPDRQTYPVTVYQKPEQPKQPTRIAQLNEELTRLHMIKREGYIRTPEQNAQYRLLLKQRRAELHEEMERLGFESTGKR